MARSCASRRSLSWLLPTRWQLWGTQAGCCPHAGSCEELTLAAALRLPRAWCPGSSSCPACGCLVSTWLVDIAKKNTLLAAAPLFFKLKIIISFNIQKSKFYPPHDYISFSSSCIPFSFSFFRFFNFLFSSLFILVHCFVPKEAVVFFSLPFCLKKRTFFQFCLVFVLALSYTFFSSVFLNQGRSGHPPFFFFF